MDNIEKAIYLGNVWLDIESGHPETETYHFVSTAVKALEALQDIKAIVEINAPNRGTCNYFIVDKIEEIINKYKAESEDKE